MIVKTVPAESEEWIVDTNIWIDFFDKPNDRLVALLRRRVVRLHEVVIAEMMLPDYEARRTLIQSIPNVPVVGSSTISEAIDLMREMKSKGIKCGISDYLILKSCLDLSMGLWTKDERAKKSAKMLGVKLMA